ncbi:hypothetical protein GA0061099_103912 [Bradyrhizobium yuanmingense]|uniref:Uncharacterized protein n=1 Tax=Bradyrhizobium yuanmingense TaxID=108015 RepID=A0A1C3XL07_9BRAD|nr:hypothetical protein IQ15_07027 [Bradyrhizobium yuanmingense]SCB52736.1 hypothetical protein GA0061099_103912 [Bradyrhizobium yuanmingense]
MNNVSALSGMLQTISEPVRQKRRAKMLFALFAASLLVGCKHTEETLTAATARQAKCDWTSKITYSKRDTAPTIEQIQIHNRSGRNVKCWK